MEKKTKQIIGVCCILYSLFVILVGLFVPSLFDVFRNSSIVTVILTSSIVLIGFLIVGLLLIFEKKK